MISHVNCLTLVATLPWERNMCILQPWSPEHRNYIAGYPGGWLGAGWRVAGSILLLQVFKVANFKHTLVTSFRKWLPQPPLEQLLHSAFRKPKNTRIASIQNGTLINAYNQYISNLLRSVNVECLKRGPADTHARAV